MSGDAELETPTFVSTWADRANCRGVLSSLFFENDPAAIERSQVVCGGCVVRDSCRAFAAEHGFAGGVWGGMSTSEHLGGAAHPVLLELLHPSTFSVLATAPQSTSLGGLR